MYNNVKDGEIIKGMVIEFFLKIKLIILKL